MTTPFATAALLPGAPAVPALPTDALGAARAATLLHTSEIAMPELMQTEPVARFLEAFAAFESAARAGDQAAVFGARLVLLETALALEGIDAEDVIAPPAMILRFSISDDVYNEDIALIYDAGGNDVYNNNAGGSGILVALPASESCIVHAPPTSAALFDLGGNDVYGDSARGCGTVGGAATGAALLYDEAGDDVYRAANDGTIGGGTNGIAFLMDVEGNDLYDAGGWGTNGGAYPGASGMLLDLGGNDDYRATHDAVNGGSFLGRGLLYDEEGDDSYVALGSGANGGGFGGVGLLLDEAGHDWYDDGDSAVGWDLTVLPKLTGAQVDR